MTSDVGLPAAGSGQLPGTPPVERQVALDMLRRGLPVAPVLVLAATLVWGGDGAWSAIVAVALVLTNFVLSALALSWAARKSPAALMATALGGFAVRMGLVWIVLWLFKDESWIDLTALGILVLVTHLGLLFWETRFVSASLAYPGLHPAPPQEKHAA